MIDKLQEAYNQFIKMADMNYTLSKENYMKPIQRELVAKCEAFEAAADGLWSKFPNEIKTKETLRFESIRKGHMEEESTEEPRVIIEPE